MGRGWFPVTFYVHPWWYYAAAFAAVLIIFGALALLNWSRWTARHEEPAQLRKR